MDAFRINCSHSKNEQLTSYVENIRKVEKKLKKPIGILIDLQGPKLRIGEIKNNYMELKKGQKIILVNKKTVSNSNEIPLPDKNIFKSIRANQPIFIDDGKIKLKVLSVNSNIILTKVILEGILKSNKGLNLPETYLKRSSLTDLDKKNVKLGIKLGIDWVALSLFKQLMI